MTEQEWLTCPSKQLLTSFPSLSCVNCYRKNRLCAVALVRQFSRRLDVPEFRAVTDAAEYDADKRIKEHLADFDNRAIGRANIPSEACFIWVGDQDPDTAVEQVRIRLSKTVLDSLLRRVIHDIFGNPFRPINFKPEWRTPDVARLAEASYERRGPHKELDEVRLRVLSDALEDAGCDQPLLLDVLRLNPHVPCDVCWVYGSFPRVDSCLVCGNSGSVGRVRRYRGFWALDLVLGKE